MSSAFALAITPNARPTMLAEFQNASGWAPSIWQRMLRHRGFNGNWLTTGDLDRLWKGIDSAPGWERVPLILTADVGVILRADFGWAAACLDEFEQRLPAPTGHVNHVPAVASLLRSQPDAPMFGMWCTSVTDNPFDPWDDERDAPGHGLPVERLNMLERTS